MSLTLFHRALIAVGLITPFWAAPAQAQTFGSCAIATANASLGSAGSFTVATQAQNGSGSSGMSCSAISVATSSYLKVRLVSSTFLLTGPGGRTIPFSVSPTSGGAPLAVGGEADFSGFNLIALFAGPGGAVPLYFSTTATGGLAAGTYTGSVNLRWYFSVCTLGVAICLVLSESPGFSRGGTVNWGTGVSVTVNVSLTVDKDCLITAPNVDFGSVPLVSRFNPVTRTISIRCSADTSYTVGLSDGDNFLSGWRRLRLDATSNYLRYEIYQGNSGTTRWGSAGAERRSSGAADQNAGTYDAITLQGYDFRAVIDPTQATPPAGTYRDTIMLTVAF